MDILSNLASLLGQGAAPQQGTRMGGGMPQQQGQASDGLAGLFTPSVLSSLAGALLGGKGGFSPTAGARAPQQQAGGLGDLGGMLSSILGGAAGGQGGGGMASILSSLMGGGETPPPAPMAKEPTIEHRAENLLRALIYAVKADGKIDAAEEKAINEQVHKMNLGSRAQSLVDKFLAEPLNPSLIAQNITSSDEALNIYALSCAITQMDHQAERQYLDSLANALQIPMSVRQELARRILG